MGLRRGAHCLRHRAYCFRALGALVSASREAWLVWARRFDGQPEPQIFFDFIPASFKPLVVASHPLNADDAGRTVEELAAKFPAPEVSP